MIGQIVGTDTIALAGVSQHVNCAFNLYYNPILIKLKIMFSIFYSESYTDTSKTRARLTLSDRHTGMMLCEIAAQAATPGEYELTRFSFDYIRFVVHPSALQPNEGLRLPPKLVIKLTFVSFIL